MDFAERWEEVAPGRYNHVASANSINELPASAKQWDAHAEAGGTLSAGAATETPSTESQQ